jgi:hypothetical protein
MLSQLRLINRSYADQSKQVHRALQMLHGLTVPSTLPHPRLSILALQEKLTF